MLKLHFYIIVLNLNICIIKLNVCLLDPVNSLLVEKVMYLTPLKEICQYLINYLPIYTNEVCLIYYIFWVTSNETENFISLSDYSSREFWYLTDSDE